MLRAVSAEKQDLFFRKGLPVEADVLMQLLAHVPEDTIDQRRFSHPGVSGYQGDSGLERQICSPSIQ
jgi:hypothetical protein